MTFLFEGQKPEHPALYGQGWRPDVKVVRALLCKRMAECQCPVLDRVCSQVVGHSLPHVVQGDRKEPDLSLSSVVNVVPKLRIASEAQQSQQEPTSSSTEAIASTLCRTNLGWDEATRALIQSRSLASVAPGAAEAAAAGGALPGRVGKKSPPDK